MYQKVSKNIFIKKYQNIFLSKSIKKYQNIYQKYIKNNTIKKIFFDKI